ncbi:hypothetical protein BJ878DRAFT_48262 [Calycina marina]|uniref:Transcription regulator Rua1 C-terminal domain-containing protein n=1 Tax=Calycina marina TaxID=1763456 RepID=A0A9P7Z3E0_9HELO|nr:hypothetical protein BJ878DRAFT_48262 [Calycina marina]
MDPSRAHLRHQISTPSFAFSSDNNNNNKFRRDQPQTSYAPRVTMNSNEMTMKTESVGLGMWSSPASIQTPQTVRRHRPATIHESAFPQLCLSEDYNSLPAWDSSTMPMQSMNICLPQTYSVQQDFYPPTIGKHNWTQKNCEETIDIHQLDSDMHMSQAYTNDETVPILDLRYSQSTAEGDRSTFDQYSSRRMSGSSFTLSTSGGLSEMQSSEDFSATLSEAPSFTSDYPPTSNRNSLMSSTQLSPVASPRMTPQGRSELVRTQSRGRASPSPRPTMRSAPYNMDSARNKRWSTGSYATLPTRRPSPFVFHQGQESSFTSLPPTMSSRHSSPTLPNPQLPLNMHNLHSQQQQHPYLMSNNQNYHRNTMLLPSNSYHDHPPQYFKTPPPLLSHGLFRMLQSNADPHSLHSHYTDLSDPPDLYDSLHEEQVPPPPEDMNPNDPDLIPHEQELRFDGDLYTPRWVRGHGNKREGWCGICKPGRWLVLKNSAFWYDKSFTHGISAATGSPFQEPQETRRMDGNPDVWEGLCGSCNEWVALVSSKKKGTTWFRHAYKCHTHPKIKDAPKRRRESSHNRALAASTTAKPKIETPMTPQMTPSNWVSTPTSSTLQNQHQYRNRNRQNQHQQRSKPNTPTNFMEGLLGMI